MRYNYKVKISAGQNLRIFVVTPVTDLDGPSGKEALLTTLTCLLRFILGIDSESKPGLSFSLMLLLPLGRTWVRSRKLRDYETD